MNKNTVGIPELRGLVLAGGRSKRMGHDKASITWQGKAHWLFLAEMLNDSCRSVHISCREDQQASFNPFPVIIDKVPDSGPMSGIVAAFETHPHAAWLVVACDLPLLNQSTLAQLITERDAAAYATSFTLDGNQPEPLVTIYEPGIFSNIFQSFTSGDRSLRRVLKEVETKVVAPQSPLSLININSPADLEILQEVIDASTDFNHVI